MSMDTEPAIGTFTEDANERRVWLWYPQVGGYCSRALVTIAKHDQHPGSGIACFQADVYHDGEFPFETTDGREPASLHHCHPLQFVAFGADVLEQQRAIRAFTQSDRDEIAAMVARLLALVEP